MAARAARAVAARREAGQRGERARRGAPTKSSTQGSGWGAIARARAARRRDGRECEDRRERPVETTGPPDGPQQRAARRPGCTDLDGT
eukprot:CAMPEP_0119408066 /NCGR_PEP_ID=MMETSP1335-20130426/1740_1 /TAXON_ID=259385 /ORGANISM="Chrysoculter rhomboideus, Strain RCC1486" /LENGTH=87 /DNA_ID=CAMNT_0007432255 /DNA_START=79 /DNA_END=342 /DNA_ORIENTATION=-